MYIYIWREREIEREGEREREISLATYKYTHAYVCIHIYIYIYIAHSFLQTCRMDLFDEQNMERDSDVKTRTRCKGNYASDVATNNNMYMHMQTHGYVHVRAPTYEHLPQVVSP